MPDCRRFLPCVLALTLIAAAAGQSQPDPAEVKRLADSAQAFAPTKVHLKAVSAPLAAVVADLAQQAHVQLHVAREPADLAERLVTLDTGETSFWEAFDALCRQAKVSIQPGEFDLAVANSGGVSSRASRLAQRGVEDVLVLQDGALPPCPTAYVGAVRIRLVPDRWSNRGRALGDERRWALEVLSEPHVSWQGLPTFRFEPAAGLTANPESQSAANSTLAWGDYLVRSGGGALRPVTRFEPPAFVKAERAAGRAVAELHGTLTGAVRLGEMLTLTVADVQKGDKLGADAPDGSRVSVRDLKVNVLGAVMLRADVERPALDKHFRSHRARLNGTDTARLASSVRDGETFRLFDTQNRPYKMLLRFDEVIVEGKITTVKYILDGEPPGPDAQPHKLELDVPRRAPVEAKFTLRGVPVP